MPEYITEVPGYAAAHSPYSHAVVAKGVAYVSGQIAVRPNGAGPMDIVGETVVEQTKQALENVDRVLRASGSSLRSAVKITVLLAEP